MSRPLGFLIAGWLLAVVATLPASGQSDFIRGDVDGDGVVSGIPDGLYLLNHAFLPGHPAPPCLDAADVDDNGTLNGLIDGIYLLNSQFVPGSPLPPPPYPVVGPDPTPDVLGCGGLDFETIVQSDHSGAPEQLVIIRDAVTWESVWTEHTSIFYPPLALPDVDFNTEMVVAVIRHFTSGGYFMTIDSLILNGGHLEVHYTLGAPIGGCPTTDVLTQPHHFVRTAIRAAEPVPSETMVDSCP